VVVVHAHQRLVLVLIDSPWFQMRYPERKTTQTTEYGAVKATPDPTMLVVVWMLVSPDSEGVGTDTVDPGVV